jgi:pSer/pThr/pTyr-binding forkhead associated (FHA) protein
MRDYVDQVLDDSSVSRMHARFSLDRDGKMTVRDLNSSNGTWLNGERLQPNESRTLQQGDHVRLGRMEFVFR